MTAPVDQEDTALLDSFGRRLVMTCGAAATLACALLVTAVLVTASAESRRELGALAALLAESAAPALAGDNPAPAQRTLDSLRGNRAVLAGAIYRLTGGPWVQFRQPLGEALPSSPPAAEGFESARGEEARRIRSTAGTTLGWVWLRANPARQQDLALKCFGFALLAVLGTMGGAAVVAARWSGPLLRPLSQMLQVAARVAHEENLAVRVDTPRPA